MTVSIFNVKTPGYSEHQDRTPGPTPAVDTGEQLAHVSGGITVAGTASYSIEDFLQFVTARDDHPDANSPQFKQQPEIIQIPVVKRIFVVPLKLKGNAVLEAVDFLL